MANEMRFANTAGGHSHSHQHDHAHGSSHGAAAVCEIAHDHVHDHEHDHNTDCVCGHDHNHDHGAECACGHDHAEPDYDSLFADEAGDSESAMGPVTHTTFRVHELDCPECAKKVQTAARRAKGVVSADLLFSSATLVVEHTGPKEDIIRAVARVGQTIVPIEELADRTQTGFMIRNRRALLTLASGISLVTAYALGRFAPANPMAQRAFYVLAIAFGGYMPAVAGLKAAFGGFSFDMNFLMTLAVTGAAIIGEWNEAASVVFLFSLGNALEAYTLEKTRRSIRDLMDVAPVVALVRRGTEEVTVAVSELQRGEIALIRPGGRVPADGVVVLGESEVNQAPITGESMPVSKSAGSELFAGTINGSGYLEMRVEKVASDSTIARIVRLVEQAQVEKSPSERFVDKFARYYTPTVILLAFGVAIVPPLFGAAFAPWFYRALSLLVVSCPCALVISTPVSIASAISSAARYGVLVKGGAHIEQAGNLRAIAFDKTGTITLGVQEVTDLVPLDITEQQLVAMAASVEQFSEHPFAQAVAQKAEALGIEYEPATAFSALMGRGARATTAYGDTWVVSPEALGELQGISELWPTIESLRDQGKSVSVVATADRVHGAIAVADKVRPEAAESVAELRRLGVERIIMLTGDNATTAAHIAAEAGIDEFRADLFPEDKVSEIKRISADNAVAMVGDGINDAPALATADIGVAMGAAGTDVALETADIALMGDDLSKLVFTIALSRKTMGVIRQNVIFSLAVKLIAVALVFPGLLTLWLAIAADTGAALVVILNGMRLLGVKPSSAKA